jgi:NADPH:quinone reductase-like Zn-dependent oxidoreductase
LKAFIHTKYGPPEVLKLSDIPIPVPGGKDILIKIQATTVNRTDNGFLRADPFIARFFTGLFRPKNNIPGSEFAGQVEAAGEVVDYTIQDFTQIDKTFDVVFDAVGKSSFRTCKPLLKDSGIYVSTDLGFMAQNPFLAIITPLLGGKKVLFPIPKIDKEMINYLKGLAETGLFNPVIDRRYHFEQIPEAFEYVHTGQKTGNVVVTLD